MGIVGVINVISFQLKSIMIWMNMVIYVMLLPVRILFFEPYEFSLLRNALQQDGIGVVFAGRIKFDGGFTFPIGLKGRIPIEGGA